MSEYPSAGGWARRSSRESPLTHRDEQNGDGWEWCKCGECGHIAVSTPNHDFYVRWGDESGMLVCETCITRQSPR